jgi:hypothetical protein
MNRRDFLKSSAMALASGRQLAKGTAFDRWRTFELKTRVEVLKSSGTTRVWLPEVLIRDTPFQRTLGHQLTADGGTTKTVVSGLDGLEIITAEFRAGVPPALTLTSRVATRNYTVDLTGPAKVVQTNRAELEHFLRPTKLLPTDGIVKATADKVTKGASTDLQKARSIYDFIVDNTSRDPKNAGAGEATSAQC